MMLNGDLFSGTCMYVIRPLFHTYKSQRLLVVCAPRGEVRWFMIHDVAVFSAVVIFPPVGSWVNTCTVSTEYIIYVCTVHVSAVAHRSSSSRKDPIVVILEVVTLFGFFCCLLAK